MHASQQHLLPLQLFSCHLQHSAGTPMYYLLLQPPAALPPCCLHPAAHCSKPGTTRPPRYPPVPCPQGLTLLGLAAPAACAGASFMPRSLALILPISSVSSQYLQGGSGNSYVKEMSWQQQLLPSCTHDTLRATVLVQVASHSTHVGCCASGAAPAPHITLALQSCQLVCLPAERSV